MSNRPFITEKDIHCHREGGVSLTKVFAAGLVTIILAGLAYHRNEVWTTKLSLWTDVSVKTPDKSRVRNSLGNCYALLGKHFEAIQEYETALALDPGNAEVYYNLASTYEIVGIYNRAIHYYQVFCSLAPSGYPDATTNACRQAEHLENVIKK